MLLSYNCLENNQSWFFTRTLHENCPCSEFFWSVLSRIRTNMGRYGVSLRIQSECGQIQTRKTPHTDTFHAMTGCTWSKLCQVFRFCGFVTNNLIHLRCPCTLQIFKQNIFLQQFPEPSYAEESPILCLVWGFIQTLISTNLTGLKYPQYIKKLQEKSLEQIMKKSDAAFVP